MTNQSVSVAHWAHWVVQGMYTIGSMFAVVHEAFARHVLGAFGWGVHAAVGAGWLTLYALNRGRPRVEFSTDKDES